MTTTTNRDITEGTASPAGTAAHAQVRRALRAFFRPACLIIPLSLLVLGIAQTGSVESEMSHDSAHYLELARSLTRGEGFTTYTRWAHNIPKDGLPFPDTYRSPLYPLLIGGAAKLFPGSDLFTLAKWISVLSGAFVPFLVYVLARHRFGLAPAFSFGAALLAMIHHHLVVSSTRALTETPYTIAVLVALYVASARPARPLLAGVAAGVAWLLRYQALVLVPVALLLLLRPGAASGHLLGRRFWSRALVFAGAFLVTTAPWMIRNARVAGSPFYTDLRYHVLSTYDTERTTYEYFHGLTPAPEPLAYILSNPGQTARHIVLSLKRIAKLFPRENAGNPLVLVLAMAGAWIVYRRRRAGPSGAAVAYITFVLVAFGVANVVLVGAAFVDHRHLTSLDPIVIVLAAVGVAALWQSRRSAWARGGAVALASVAVLWEASAAHETLAPERPFYQAVALVTKSEIGERIGPSEAVMGEKPYHLSYVLDRPAVSLPWAGDEDVLEIARRYGVRYICVTPKALQRPYPGSFLETQVLPPWLAVVAVSDDPAVTIFEVQFPHAVAVLP